MKGLHKIVALGAIILAAVLYYVLILGQYADKVNYVGR